jgi:hypothetical protein
MSQSVKSFGAFLTEASLRGNVGIPGEEGSDRESWLDIITQSGDAAAIEFANRNRQDIGEFMSGRLISRSQRLQRGHEEALSKLTVDAFTEIFGSLLEETELDFKIVGNREIAVKMEKTPTEEEKMELDPVEPLDPELVGHVHKRKILRTIQQGKGLSSKSILNLSIFKDGLTEIMGEEVASEYLSVLNKISNVAQFLDWTVPEDQKKAMWQTRSGFSGVSDIEFKSKPKKEESKEDLAKKVLDDLEDGKDLTDIPEADDVVKDFDVVLVARGVDLSVLIHESIKAVYKLITQASLEHLYGGQAEKVLGNTDTLFDELQELKFGPKMQEAFFKAVRECAPVKKRVDEMLQNDESDTAIASFQERVDYLFFNAVSQLGQEDPAEFLDLVNAILSESKKAEAECERIADDILKSLDQESEYQSWSRGETSGPASTAQPSRARAAMTQDEISDAIIDAYQRGDTAEADRLRKMLRESISANAAWPLS